MKTIKSLFILLMLLCCTIVTIQSAFASDAMPMSDDLVQAYASLSVDSNGQAHCTLNVRSRLPQYKIQAVMTLNQVSSNMPTPIKSWTLNGTYSISGTKTYYVMAGHTYQLAVDVTVTDSSGNIIDSFPVHSSLVIYS